jgi:Response regulator containing CheY-like receiver, AAA-type ATPase, and DNA-binding domains
LKNNKKEFRVLKKYDTVLVVEDDDSLRDLLKSMLEAHDFKVLTAFDGINAIEVFTQNKDTIGVVLSDLGLPGLGGWDAFLRMKEINPEIKGILASGYFHPGVKEEIIKSGAENFIQKPYNTPEIVAMLHRMLEEEE